MEKSNGITVQPNSVELIGTYGGDETHAASAWTSTVRDLTDSKIARIPKLLKMLAQSEPQHTSPFEKSFIHFLVTADTASHIHLIKHRIGVSVNGESARYKELEGDKAVLPIGWPTLEDINNIETPADRWVDEIDTLPLWSERYYSHLEEAFDLYHKCLADLEPLVGRKRAKESARFFLPYGNQLTLDVGFNFNSFMHFQKLRNDDEAQEEIHEIAREMLKQVWNTGDFDASLEAFGYTKP